MTDYTLTTEGVRAAYGVAVTYPTRSFPERQADFDRWLEQVKAEARDAALNDAYRVASDTAARTQSIDAILAALTLRTLDRLPRPEPDWLDAPAVLAAMDDCSWQKVWLPSTPGHWECTCCGVDRHWSKMNDVTPLYPKEDKGGMYITGSGDIQFKDRSGQIVWEI